MRAEISSAGCVNTASLPCDAGNPGAPDGGGTGDATRGGIEEGRRAFLATESIPTEEESEVRSMISCMCGAATEISSGMGGGSFVAGF